jgi:CRISPR-associated endonuclease/helicase Cas3
MRKTVESYFQYWGKAKRDPQAEGPDYHLLPYHCLDVAAVGYLLLDLKKPLCKQLAAQLNVEPEWLQAWFCFCLMLHDLGKFFRAFQNLAPNLSTHLVQFDARCVYSVRHDTLGFALWQKVLRQKLQHQVTDEYKLIFERWLEVVCGHHGKPPENLQSIKSYLLAEDEIAAEQFVADVMVEWMPDLAPLKSIDKKVFKRVSWQLAGIAVLTDWLGSSQKVFKYCTKPMQLKKYWTEMALPRANQAIELVNFGCRDIKPFESIRQQFSFIKHSTPLQTYAQSVELNDSQQMFILEDVTGAGKTEAAMVLVHRLMASGLANGLYVGLPTMATANAMYQRMAKSYRSLYAEHELPSLVLAHGATRLSEAFNQSIAFSETVNLTEQAGDKNYEKDELSASAYCNQWLADSRKKALLADVGVGTIDQALLGVLPARHQSLRLLGLTNKVLLVDEVHAFDPYMRSLLAALLQAHAAQGGSVVLLSATLPYNFRLQLTKAFAQGAGFSAPQLTQDANYPWVTQFNNQKFSERPVDTRKSVERRVAVKRLENEEQAYAQIKQAVAQGRCVCWIRNTVKDARNAYQYLQQQDWIDPGKLSLFHSRYAMVDRQVIEVDVVSRFGKESGGVERTGQVLIATQVVEQSLDLDFDLMISDLAPVDLLIQRAGRLQRHIRTMSGDIIDGGAKDQREPPCLCLLSPDPLQVNDGKWLRDLLPGTQAVYANVGQLWLTIKGLLNNNGFEMPKDARALIEGVYGDDAQGDIPPELEKSSKDAEAKQRAESGMGKFNLLVLEKGYTQASADHNGGWSEEVNIPTRLGGDTVTVALVREVKGEWIAYAGEVANKWALSQLSLPKVEWEMVKTLISESLLNQIDVLKSGENSLVWVEVLPLVGELNDLYRAKDGWLGGKTPAGAGNNIDISP